MRKLILFTENDFEQSMKKAGLKTEDYSEEQLFELRKGAMNGVDISVFSDPKLSNIQMKIIRWGLEEGLDASVYADPSISYYQMNQKFIQIEREHSCLGELDLLLANVV